MRIAIPITGVTGQGRSLNANNGQTMNCYVEQTAEGKTILVGSPGLKLKTTIPNAPSRGSFSDTSVSYCVFGNGVYKIQPDYTFALLGNINTYNGIVKFASSGIDLMFVDGTDGWSIKLATGVLTKITAAAFPTNPSDVIFTKGYFVVTKKNTQLFYVSQKLNIATSWNGLDFATAEGNPDNTTGLVEYQDETLFFGYRSVEVWNFTGNVDFPFQRNINAVIDHGCAAPLSTARVSDSVYWLGGDKYGQGIVWRLDGYTPTRVSTHEIEQKIAKLSFISDAYALSYHQEGHQWYILQFPSSNLTLCYDAATGLWSERCWRDPLTGICSMWRVATIWQANGRILAGDIQGGQLYEVFLDEYTDNGAPILRERTTTETDIKLSRIFYNRLLFDMEAGVGNEQGQGTLPKLWVQWSDDSGHNWSNWRTVSIGKIGDYNRLPALSYLGSGRNRSWRIRMTDPVKFIFKGLVLEYDEGQS